MLGKLCFTIALTACLALAANGGDQEIKNSHNPEILSQPGFLSDWRKLEVAPILQYAWPGTETEEERLELFQNYLKMGFTGVYKVDHDQKKRTGNLFIEHGLHGFMPEIQFYGPGEPTLDRDGAKKAYTRNHPWEKSIFSPVSRDSYYKRALNSLKEYGLENLFTCEDTILMSSWDETGIFSRLRKEYGYGAKDEFIKFLRNAIFEDDIHAFNKATSLNIKKWNEIELPVFEERYEQPGLWKYWVDFHAYYTYLFFRRGGEYVSSKLNHDVEFWTFSHGSVKWPGAASWSGIDHYWAAKLNRILTVEDCQGTYPGSTIHYSFTDQLSRRYELPVIGWSWFWPRPDRSNDPLKIGRALARAMGHNTHGLIFWVYMKEHWDQKPEAGSAIAYWHHTFQAHWDFLKNARRPKPAVAVIRSRNTGNMYRRFDYPKLDFGWTCAALTEAHIPFEVISSNQVEFKPEILSDYRVLLIPTATWESPQFKNAVSGFIANGGYVYTSGDSFMMDIATGKTTNFLRKHFGILPRKKYKALAHPTYDSEAEYNWLKGFQEEELIHRLTGGKIFTVKWQTPEQADGELKPLEPVDDDIKFLSRTLPSRSGTGLIQRLWDPRKTQFIYSNNIGGLPKQHRTYHDIITGQPIRNANVLAYYKNEVCAVETEKTLWTGFRPGFDHAYEFPVSIMRKWGERIWPFEINKAVSAKERADSRRWITKIVKKAGINPPLEVMHNGKQAAHIEILKRLDHEGNAFVFAINHEGISGEYALNGDVLADAESIADLRNAVMLNKDVSNNVAINIPAFDVVILAAGDKTFVKERVSAHKQMKKLIRQNQ